jgi:hypothetical protein
MEAAKVALATPSSDRPSQPFWIYCRSFWIYSIEDECPGTTKHLFLTIAVPGLNLTHLTILITPAGRAL